MTLLHSDTVSETDVRSKILRTSFGDCLGEGFVFEAQHGATLFDQGTELTAMQRGNLDMANLAIFDFQNQVPSTAILGTPFLFRDYDHMRAVYDGDTMAGIEAEIEAGADVKVLAYPYIGARHLGYKGEERKMTPEDPKGMVLRMPGGEGWQIEGQDNGFPAVRSMKFDEIINHIGMTSHLIAANEFTISLEKWNSMNADQQAKVQECALNFQSALDAETIRLETELKDDMIAKGMDVYMPDNAAFQAHVLGVYQASDYSKTWPAGPWDAIQAVGK